MKKVIAIIMAIIMIASFAACNKQSDSLDKQTGNIEASSENHTDNTDDIEKPSADMIDGTVNGSELSSENKNNTTEKPNIGSSNNNNETAGDKNNSAINNSDSSANKPNNENNSSNIKPNLPNSSNNNTDNNKPTEKPAESTNPSKPEKPSNPVEPTEPDETTTPSQHEHNWSSGWFDTEIAKDKSGNKVSLHLCAKCYEYFGSTSGDEWVGRFWDHCDTVHEAGYTTWPLYAYYEAEWCSGCDTMKRGKFAFYGYCDYSVPNKVSTRKLEPWQVEELNLPLK